MKKVLFLLAMLPLFAHSEDYNPKKWSVTMETGYKIVDIADAAFGASAGVRYDITDNFYAASGAGFNITQLEKIGDYYTDFNTISIPVELGVKLLNKEKTFGVILFSAIINNIATSGTISALDYEKDLNIGGDIGAAERLGIRLHFFGVELTGSYHIPINNNQKGWYGDDTFIELSIGVGINNVF